MACLASLRIIVNNHNQNTGYQIDRFVLVTPHSKLASPKALRFFRVIAFLWCVFILVHTSMELGWYHIISYYTMWNFILLTIYFGLAALLSLPPKSSSIVMSSFAEPPTPNEMFGSVDDVSRHILSKHEKAVLVLAQVCFPMSWLVTTLTWGLLLPWGLATNGDLSSLLNFISYNTHILNAVLMTVDFALTPIPYYAYCVCFLFMWGSFYAFQEWLSFYVGGNPYSYPFLATDTWLTLFWYPALFLAHAAFFFLARFVSNWKRGLSREGLLTLEHDTYNMMHQQDELSPL